MELIFLLIVAAINTWVWRVLSINPFIAVTMVVSSLVLYNSIKQGKFNKLLIPLILIMLVLEYTTTVKVPLTSLSNQEKIDQRLYLDAYPPVFLKIENKPFYISIAHWLEERKETLIVYRITQNISGALSPNLYFFANHPNERVGIKEFEKFPYLLFPFFVVGFLTLDYRKNRTAIILSLLLPLLLIMFIGDNNLFGPFILFPIIVSFIASGLYRSYRWIVNFGYGKLLTSLFLICYAIVLVQIFLYETF